MSFIKSLVSRWRRHGNTARYQPLSMGGGGGDDGTETDAEDMDDLMLMASEADRARYLGNDDDGPNLEDGAVFTSVGRRFRSRMIPEREGGSCRVSCECRCGPLSTKTGASSPWLLALSFLTILAVSGVSVGLGYYSMFVLKPEPVIDKSIDSFSIPNHQAYRHFDALNLARKYNASQRRFRRDAGGDGGDGGKEGRGVGAVEGLNSRFRRDTGDDGSGGDGGKEGRGVGAVEGLNSRFRRDTGGDGSDGGDGGKEGRGVGAGEGMDIRFRRDTGDGDGSDGDGGKEEVAQGRGVGMVEGLNSRFRRDTGGGSDGGGDGGKEEVAQGRGVGAVEGLVSRFRRDTGGGNGGDNGAGKEGVIPGGRDIKMDLTEEDSGSNSRFRRAASGDNTGRGIHYGDLTKDQEEEGEGLNSRFRRAATDNGGGIEEDGDLTEDNGGGGGENSREKRSRGNQIVDSSVYQRVKRWKMQVIYLAQGDDDPNIFTAERLRMIHKIERDIVAHPRWRQFCLRDTASATYDPAVRAHNDCAPLNSLLSYFFPSEDDENGEIFYDGFGDNMGNINSSLRLAMNHQSFYYFVDAKINRTYQKSHMLRTEVLFGAPLPGFLSLGDHSQAQSDMYKEFVITYIDLLSQASTHKVRVLYGSNELFDYEVEHTFWSDVHLAVFAVASIAAIMFLMTSFSLYLTFMGLWCIVLAFPIAIFFYRVVFNIVGLGIMNGAAAFVIIGIGVDDVFVFINIFRQTTHLQSVSRRLVYTVRTAGYATFCTSFTTAMAFTCNITSAIPAVYEFGLFMSLIVAGCWMTVFLIMPATLYVYAFWFEPLENMCSSLCCRCVRSGDSGAVSQRLVAHSAASTDQHPQSDDDDDVPLITLENEGDQDGDDVVMLLPDMAGPTQEAATSSSAIGRIQQRFLGVLVDRVIIPWRIPIIVLFGLIFVASVGMVTQLSPSSHPPQLFEPDTNLQRLLDLKANFSMIDTLRCDRCSALYNVGKEDSKPRTPAPPRRPPPPTTTREPPLPPQPAAITTLKPATTKVAFPFPKPASTAVPGQTMAPVPVTTTTTTTPATTTAARRMTTRKTAPTPSPARFNETSIVDSVFTKVMQRVDNYFHHNVEPPPNGGGAKAKSTAAGFDSCKKQNCDNIKARPVMQSGATVYVVFGVSGINRTGVQQGHVLTQFKGRPNFDARFADEVGDLAHLQLNHLRELCKVCHAFAENTDLVKPGSAQCLPTRIPYALTVALNTLQECRHLPKTLTIYNHEAPSHAEASINAHGKLIWLAFAFESTVSKGESYFEAYKKYQAWEEFMTHVKTNVLAKDSPLSSIYQTSEFWEKVLMEMVAINSAAYSVVLSLVVCMCAVGVFTGHAVMLLIIMITIIALIALVVAIFFMAGWQMGAVEAVSLSILVGSSVDYCVHLVEGYLLMGKNMPHHITAGTKKEQRSWRTSKSIQHIGSAIISSAVTTMVAAIPLTQTVIQPFSKFGSIVLINSSVSILFTLTLCVALLATMAPPTFTPTWRSHLKAAGVTSLICGLGALSLYIAHVSGADVPGPNGGTLFG